VVGEHLRVILRPPERLDPLGRQPVLLRAGGARDLAVGDVADEQVPEGVLRLVGDRGPPRPLHEILPLKRMQALLGR